MPLRTSLHRVILIPFEEREEHLTLCKKKDSSLLPTLSGSVQNDISSFINGVFPIALIFFRLLI